MAARLTKTTAMSAVVLMAAMAVATNATAERGRSADAGLGAVRAWTERYRSEAAAVADGFTPSNQCVPAMGYHYVDFSRVDTKLEPSRPEALLYAPAPDGGRILAGAEWIVVDRDQDLATDDDRPEVFGHPFDGPMPGHGAAMPIHYDLHAWAWIENAAGGFATWNSAISCPARG